MKLSNISTTRQLNVCAALAAAAASIVTNQMYIRRAQNTHNCWLKLEGKNEKQTYVNRKRYKKATSMNAVQLRKKRPE